MGVAGVQLWLASACRPWLSLAQLSDCLQDNRIRPFTMPLMSLAATAIDQPKPRQKVTATMLQYLDTDAICCREEPGKLADQQAKVVPLWPCKAVHSCTRQAGSAICWHEDAPAASSSSSLQYICACGALLQVYNPVLAWANQQFDVKFAVSNSIFGAHQDADTHQAVRQFLQGKQLKTSLTATTKYRCCNNSCHLCIVTMYSMSIDHTDLVHSLCCLGAGLDDWHLAAMESLASSCRSVVLALAVMHVSDPLLYTAISS